MCLTAAAPSVGPRCDGHEPGAGTAGNTVSGSKKSTGMLYHFPGLMGDRPGGSDTRAHSALSDKLNSTLEN